MGIPGKCLENPPWQILSGVPLANPSRVPLAKGDEGGFYKKNANCNNDFQTIHKISPDPCPTDGRRASFPKRG